MKKIFIITATLIVALAVFTACSGTPKVSGKKVPGTILYAKSCYRLGCHGVSKNI